MRATGLFATPMETLVYGGKELSQPPNRHGANSRGVVRSVLETKGLSALEPTSRQEDA